MEPLYDFGIAMIQAIQALSPPLDIPMKTFTFMGTIEFYLLLIPFVYWNINSTVGFRMLLALVITDFFGVSLKHLFHQPRPYWVGEVKTLSTEASYGLPSTHSSNSLAVWGILAQHYRRRWFWILTGVIVFFIAFSRLYLGVHFPQDVLGGWILAGIVLLSFWKLEPVIVGWLQTRTMVFRIGAGFCASLVVIVVGLSILALIDSFPDPQSYASFSIHARVPYSYFTHAGTLFGSILGFELMRYKARFQTSGAWYIKLARYLVGIAGLLFLYFGLDVVFGMIAEDSTPAGLILRYIRYAFVAWYSIHAAPRAFLKLRLSERFG